MQSAKSENRIDYLFFDLDGTILDVRKRLYACYVDSMGKDATSPALSPSVYFRLRRGRTPMDRVLTLSGYQKTEQDFWKEWHKRIETPSYLALDTVKPGLQACLTHAAPYAANKILITLRKRRNELLEQLKNLGIADCFDEVINTATAKDEALQHLVFARAVFIGDTEEDMLAAKKLGAYAIGVTSGARRPEFLPADMHVKSLKEVEWEKMAIHV